MHWRKVARTLPALGKEPSWYPAWVWEPYPVGRQHACSLYQQRLTHQTHSRWSLYPPARVHKQIKSAQSQIKCWEEDAGIEPSLTKPSKANVCQELRKYSPCPGDFDETNNKLSNLYKKRLRHNRLLLQLLDRRQNYELALAVGSMLCEANCMKEKKKIIFEITLEDIVTFGSSRGHRWHCWCTCTQTVWAKGNI